MLHYAINKPPKSNIKILSHLNYGDFEIDLGVDKKYIYFVFHSMFSKHLHFRFPHTNDVNKLAANLFPTFDKAFVDIHIVKPYESYRKI
jgi:hypothetical protein